MKNKYDVLWHSPLFLKLCFSCMIVLISICSSSCSNDLIGHEPLPVSLTIDGVRAKKDGKIGYEAKISNEGGIVHVIADGENQDFGYLEFMRVSTLLDKHNSRDLYIWRRRIDWSENDLQRMPEGEWGKVVFTSLEVPYAFEIVIQPNTDSLPRMFLLRFGDGGRHEAWLEIKQAARK